MGALLAKFRKAKTTTEVLERLEEKIQEIEKYSFNTQEQKKRFVGTFLAIAVGIYVIAFFVCYFVYFQSTWRDCLIYSIPLLISPFLIFFMRRLFTWYFQRKLNKNSNKLTALRAEKKKILEEVMDKETYKVAVNLLARFGDKASNTRLGTTPRFPSTSQNNQQSSKRPSGNLAVALPTNNLISNSGSNNLAVPSGTRSLGNTPRTSMQPNVALSPQSYSSITPSSRPGQELRKRTPFPIVDQQQKSVFERCVELIIGDGPSDRFALICKECHKHNGMALYEEFQYTAFNCAFCDAFNPARKTRPVAPRLSAPPSSPAMITGLTPRRRSDSSDTSSSSSDDDLEKSARSPMPIRLTQLKAAATPNIQMMQQQKINQQQQELPSQQQQRANEVSELNADDIEFIDEEVIEPVATAIYNKENKEVNESEEIINSEMASLLIAKEDEPMDIENNALINSERND